MEKLTQKEFDEYTTVRSKKRLTVDNQEIIARLHAKYFNHQFYKPCTCSASTWNQWIAQLNTLYDNGYR